jgi:limonene-1,2-epoxide hydrolase
MGKAQEDIIVQFCALWGDGTAETKPDVEGILAMMSDDAEWQLWVPGGPVYKGKAVLREEIHRQIRIASNNKCHIVNMLSNDRMVMTERHDDAIIMGRNCPHSMVAIYELDNDGLISKWREYLDMADLTRKMGVDEAFAGTGG